MLHAAPALAWHESNYETRKLCEEVKKSAWRHLCPFTCNLWSLPAMEYVSCSLYYTELPTVLYRLDN